VRVDGLLLTRALVVGVLVSRAALFRVEAAADAGWKLRKRNENEKVLRRSKMPNETVRLKDRG
jgi:hypothetical protein